MLDDLATFVGIESGSYNKAGIDQVGRVLATAFEELGFTVERIPQDEQGDHLVARRSGVAPGNLLVLIHLDTVWPRGTLAKNPFRIEDGRAYGPGVLDMKGGWVTLLWALRALRDRGVSQLPAITVFMTSDEELGSPTGRTHIEHEAQRANWSLVMEPARENGALVVQRGMVAAIYIAVQGVTAHTSQPERGASAIREMARQALAIEALTDAARGVYVNVGTAHGGSARQVIPDSASMSIDIRAPERGAMEDTLARVRAIVAGPGVPRTNATLSGGVTRPSFTLTTATQALLHLAQRYGDDLGLAVLGASTAAGSDGNFTAALGVPTLDGLGPEGGQGASREEYVTIASLPRRAALLAAIIAHLGADQREGGENDSERQRL